VFVYVRVLWSSVYNILLKQSFLMVIDRNRFIMIYLIDKYIHQDQKYLGHYIVSYLGNTFCIQKINVMFLCPGC